MYEDTTDESMHWVTAVPGHIPDQAMIYEWRSRDDIMYVVGVIDGDSTVPGLYETNKSCAQYDNYHDGPQCLPTL